MRSGATGVYVIRYDSRQCDDNVGEVVFGLLEARVNSAPLYELRLTKGNAFFRMWPIAYDGGNFRFAGQPRPWAYFTPRPVAPSATEGKADGPLCMAAAKLLDKVQPVYPENARQNRVSGIVRLHALIGKDGTVQQLRVEKGYCSLARAGLEAVRKWRYSPILLGGQCVKVDTTIDVVFVLNH
jgi:TonB family protein